MGQSRFGSQIFGDNGTVATPSISKLTNVSYFDNDGNETELTPDLEKHVLMSYEAQNFYNYITNSEARKELEKINDLTLAVSKAMKTIREKTGIKFG